MTRFRSLVVLAGATLAVAPGILSAPARAQDAPPTVAAASEGRQPSALQEVVDEIVWRPEQQGVLLIVAPDKVSPKSRPPTAQDGEAVPPRPAFLPPKGPEGLRVAALESYFPVRAAPCGDGVTVLAPATMHVLNYRNLPPPSAYAGFTPSDSFRLLQASLSQAQWRKIASPRGLGASDLSGEQRRLFLACLPQPLIVQTVEGEGTERKTNQVQVGDEQRQQVRFYMAREMGWSFAMEGGAHFHLGPPKPRTLRTVVPPDGRDPDLRRRQIFGVELLSEVPAQFKPGQLPFDWDALNVHTDLRDVKTVGDLVGRARTATGVELYCDPRYADLPIYVRGDGAKAASLLKAAARGVTGTWRRVENAFVLTDDVTGLAVRHALIADWISRNNLLASDVDKRIESALRKSKPEQYVTFAPDDSRRPNPRLLESERQHREQRDKALKTGERIPQWNKAFPIAELPPDTHAEIREQIAEINAGKHGNWQVSTELVGLTSRSVLKWDVPNVGMVAAPYDGNVIDLQLPTLGRQASRLATPKPHPVPTYLKTRALIVEQGTQTKLRPVFRAARRAGFNEVWMDVGIGSTEVEELTGAVQAARALGLKVRAVVPALRRPPQRSAVEDVEDVEDGADRNLLGETYTQALDRQLRRGFGRALAEEDTDEEPPGTAPTSPAEIEARRQRERGDWLDPASREAQSVIAGRVVAVGKTPGLAGVVLRDLMPPGYDEKPQSPFSYAGQRDTAEIQGGFRLARRLAFLKQHGVDPIDLSLTGGGGMNRHSLSFREDAWAVLELPRFPDYGPHARNTKVGGVQATQIGVKNALILWNRFRTRDAEGGVDRIVRDARAAVGGLPVWFYQNRTDTDPHSMAISLVESRDKAAALEEEDAVMKADDIATDSHITRIEPAKPVRARSSNVLYVLDLNVLSPGSRVDRQSHFLMLSQVFFDPQSRLLKTWDGVVVDFGGEAPGKVATVLDSLPRPLPVAPSRATDSLQPAQRRRRSRP